MWCPEMCQLLSDLASGGGGGAASATFSVHTYSYLLFTPPIIWYNYYKSGDLTLELEDTHLRVVDLDELRTLRLELDECSLGEVTTLDCYSLAFLWGWLVMVHWGSWWD